MPRSPRWSAAALGRSVTEADVRTLVDGHLRPLGLLKRADGSEPELKRSDPLLGLKPRVAVTDPRTTRRLTDPFRVLFRPVVAAVVLVGFVAVVGWVFFERGLGASAYDAFERPHLLLLVFVVSVLSGGFHEFGHAAAARYSGAQPGAMGAGLYLVWPAFYTDVTDSYRLGRAGRIRTDLGGLYFNAIVVVLTFVWWWATGWEALLLLVATQVLQMVQQLLPLLRFDGYHVLADLAGVPDLYHRIRPTLVGLLPHRWKAPENRVLTPWARAVITLWVLVTVPMMALMLLALVAAVPRLLGSAGSVGARGRGRAGRCVERRERPRRRRPRAPGAGSGAARAGLRPRPRPRRHPVLPGTRRVEPGLGRQARRWRPWSAPPWSRRSPGPGGRTPATIGRSSPGSGGSSPASCRSRRPRRPTPCPGAAALACPRRRRRDGGAGTGSPAASRWWRRSRRATALPTEDDPALAIGARPRPTARHRRPTAPSPSGEPTERAPGSSPSTSRCRPRRGTTRPSPSTRPTARSIYDVAFALVWAEGDEVLNVNEAHAYASCSDCVAVAVAFQVVLIMDDAQVVVPQNLAVAANYDCYRCITAAIASQLVLSVQDEPGEEELLALGEVWNQLIEFAGTITSYSLTEITAQLETVKAEIVAILGDAPPVESAPSDSTTAPTDPGADVSGSATSSPSTAEPTMTPSPTPEDTTTP